MAGEKGRFKSKGYGKANSYGYDSYDSCDYGARSGNGKTDGHSYDSYTSRGEKAGDRDDSYGNRSDGGSSGWKPSLRR